MTPKERTMRAFSLASGAVVIFIVVIAIIVDEVLSFFQHIWLKSVDKLSK